MQRQVLHYRGSSITVEHTHKGNRNRRSFVPGSRRNDILCSADR